jgi:protoporphyrinogen IX oxidase
MLWIKAFHIIAVVTWFSALFYLPRLFVYHAMTEDETGRERFKIMERKLYRGIMTPSAIVTVILGIWLISFNTAYYLQAGWMHAKLACILVLIGYHWACRHYMILLRDNRNQRGHVFFRWFNEFPVILLIFVVILVVVKPF